MDDNSSTDLALCEISGTKTDRHGYRWVWADGRDQLAHRYRYAQEVGPIPDGFHVHHLCGNTECSNPAHLVAVPPDEHLRLHGKHKRAPQPLRIVYSARRRRFRGIFDTKTYCDMSEAPE